MGIIRLRDFFPKNPSLKQITYGRSKKCNTALDPILDEADPIDQSYYLEVGSPGLGRKLTRPEHYEALKGQKVRAKLIRPNADGVRELSGILTGREGSTVTLETENGPVTFEVNAASGVQLCDDEDLFN